MKKNIADCKPLVVTLLTASFSANRSVNYIIKQDINRLRRVRALMDYAYEVCSRSGEVWLSDDSKACALLLHPHLKRTSLWSIWLDIRLIIQAIGLRNIRKTFYRENKIKKHQQKVKMTYLWFIGVDPEDQQTGIGSILLTEILAEADRKALPVYLETSTLSNIRWYSRFGFEVYDRLELDYPLFFLKREPNNQPGAC